MLKPFCSHDSLLADLQLARHDSAPLHLWWLGQSGFLLQWRGRHLLLDPYLSDSLTRKYAGTDKPHVRMTELVVDPRRLDFIDVVTSSHSHTDHLDAETLCPLLAVNPALTVLVPRANREFAAERLRVPPERLTAIDDGETITAAGCQFHGIPSAHETVERDEQGRCRFLGYVIQADALSGQTPPWTLYHPGDTIRYDGLAERLRPWQIDIAFLPINGRAPERRVAGNLSGGEAAQLAHDIGAKLVIPCHYDMFAFNTATPENFIAECRRLGQNYRVLDCGQRHTLAVGENLPPSRTA